METERTGPLSYSLEGPSGEFSAERPILVGTLVTVVSAVPVSVLGWLAHDVVGARSLVLWLAVLAVWIIGLSTAWALSPGRRRRRRNALIGVGLAAFVVSYGVYVVLDLSRPSIVQLRHSVADLELPEGWRLLSDRADGNRRCSPECPKVELVYLAPAGTENPGREVVRALLSQGWRQADEDVPPDSATAAVRGRVLADVFVVFGSREVRVVLQTDAHRFGSS